MHSIRAALRRNRCRRRFPFPPPSPTTTTMSTCFVTNDRATGIYLSDATTRLIGGKYGGDVSPREADVQTTDVSTSGGCYTRNRRMVEGPSVASQWRKGASLSFVSAWARYLGRERPTRLSISESVPKRFRFGISKYQILIPFSSKAYSRKSKALRSPL